MKGDNMHEKRFLDIYEKWYQHISDNTEDLEKKRIVDQKLEKSFEIRLEIVAMFNELADEKESISDHNIRFPDKGFQEVLEYLDNVL